MKNGFFVKTDERWAKVKYDEILWVRAFENGSVVFLTCERSLMVNHRLWRIEEMLTRMDTNPLVTVMLRHSFK